MNISAKEIKKFQDIVFNYYHTSGRDKLPWRKKINPYRIWISEVMLQQTQVDRVIGYFDVWMKKFPTIPTLANASQIEILKQWKGLGYNSRAIRMKQAAQTIVNTYKGKFPTDYTELQTLPGIGPYTAGAIVAVGGALPVAPPPPPPPITGTSLIFLTVANPVATAAAAATPPNAGPTIGMPDIEL